jgi:hypothetical protein
MDTKEHNGHNGRHTTKKKRPIYHKVPKVTQSTAKQI